MSNYGSAMNAPLNNIAQLNITVTDKSAVWTICNQDGSTSSAYATITTSTGNGVVVKASIDITHINKYVVQKATLSEVYKEFTIQTKSLI